MADIIKFNWYFGVQFFGTFSVGDPADANRFLSAAVPWVAGDVTVDKNGAGPSKINTLPARVGSTHLYRLQLTNAEMQAERVTVSLVDQTASEAWVDTLILIDTTANPGIVHSGQAQAGGASTLTLASGASAINDFYNHMVLVLINDDHGSTGAGQARIITDYAGATKVATVAPAWDTVPDNTSDYIILPQGGALSFFDLEGAEPGSSADLGDNSSWRRILQFVKRGIFDRVDQNATTRTYFKDDSATPLGTMNITPGTTQSKGKIS